MEELTLEHLAPYLPYKLQILYFGKKRTMNCSQGSSSNWISLRAVIQRFNENCMPILRPLSDLSKEVEHNGEKFVPIEKLSEWMYNEEPESFNDIENTRSWIMLNINYESNYLNSIPYKIITKLISWHFDVFGLIKKRLAIDKKNFI